MYMEDNTNKQLLDDLKNLPKVTAPENFEEGLWRKIFYGEEKKMSFWQKIFSSARFIPATATLAAVIIIFFIISSNANDYEDPLMIEPPVREDLIMVTNEDSEVSSMIEQKQKSQPQEIGNGQKIPELQKDINISQLNDSAKEKSTKERNESAGIMSTQPLAINDEVQSQSIVKEELNFLKKNLSEEEKREILELKRKIKISGVQKAE